jgi:hypothetical protein
MDEITSIYHITPKDEADNVRRIRNAGYIWAVLVWPVGLCYALYIAVAQRTASIRRHAIGVAGVAALIAAVCITAVVLITSAQQNTNVANDLRSILDSNSISYTSVGGCTHSTGNMYECSVTMNDGSQQVVTVTDDGKGYATEQGLQ